MVTRRRRLAWCHDPIELTLPCPEDWEGGPPADLERDENGRPMERKWIAGHEVIVHYDDLPPGDMSVVDGIPATTPLRTVIDLATSVDREHFDRMVQDCLDRRMFTIQEALDRVAAPDMATHPGASILRRALPTS